jgi:UDP-glucose 4-epimerase
MRLLLTGGAGYIGSHAAIHLACAGHDIVILDNFSNSKPESISNLSKIIQKPLIFYEGDIRDNSLLLKIFRDHKIEAVIHFAGFKAVAESVKNPLDYFNNNVCGTITLLQAMQSLNIKTIIFSSSATIYGDPQYLPLDESHPLNAINPYGRTKIYIEEILADLAISDRDWKIMSLRYFNPIGAHDSGLIGESPKAVPNNLMPYILEVAKGGLSQVKIYGDDYQTPDGTGVRDYIHVMDLVEGHMAALLFLNNHSGFHAINLGTGKGYSVKEIIDTFSRVTHTKVPYEIVGRRDGDVAIAYASADKAKTLLGWQAKKDLKEMCLSAWKVMSSNE